MLKKTKTVLITGGNGFIGRNIIEKFKAKYLLSSPSHSQLDLLDTERVSKFLKSNKFDVIIHAANVGGSKKEMDLKYVTYKNLKMFYNLTRNNKFFKKMIFLGSGAEYDKSKPIINVSEKDFDQNVPKDEYGFYKYVCAKFVEQVDYTTHLRLFGVFGKNEDYEVRFISNAICKAIFDLPITLSQNVFFDYLYIDDLVKIIDYFVNNESRYKIYNVGRGEKIDLLTLARKIKKISRKNLKIIVKKEGFKNEYTCDNSRLKEEIPNLKFTKIDESLSKLYSWYQSIKSSLNKESFLTDM